MSYSFFKTSVFRIYVGGSYCDSQKRIDNKIVIITGGSSGIGLEVAKELAKRGKSLSLLWNAIYNINISNNEKKETLN